MIEVIGIVFVLFAVIGYILALYFVKNCECSDEEDYEAKTWGLGDEPKKGQ